jgi:hypothetical protein
MKLLFPIVFGLIVFCSFVLPQYVAAQGYVAHLVALAVSR